MERRLAAILAADIVGYSRLMGEDEAGTLSAINAHRKELIDPKVHQYNGRIVKLMGDGALLEFASAVDAVTFAVEVQYAMAERNQDVPEKRQIIYRIGINIGDIIIEGDDIFGDGVNIAARLEGLAEPGGICVARNVFNQIKGKLDLTSKLLGKRKVKNIAEPVSVYWVELDDKAEQLVTPVQTSVPSKKTRAYLVAAGIGLLIVGAAAMAALFRPWESDTTYSTSPLSAKASIAVLPFSNLSNHPEQEYFSDGITNDLITDLSKFRDLFVIASNSAFTYKGKAVRVQDVGRDLGVRYVLEGSVQKHHDRVRINVQLIDAATGEHLWAERYDKAVANLFDLQDQITKLVVRTLAVRLTRLERDRAFAKPRHSLEAYDYVLRGRQFLAGLTRTENSKARQLFQKALANDPGYADAYAGLGQTYLNAVEFGWTGSPQTTLKRTYELAQKSLEIDNRGAAARRLLGSFYLIRRQYDLALVEFERAIAINPNDANSHAGQGRVLVWSGHPDGAILALETAWRFDPQMTEKDLTHLGMAYYLKGRYVDALKVLERGLRLNPDFAFGQSVLAATYGQLDRQEQASRTAETMRRLDPFFSTSEFGRLFRNPDHAAQLVDGLRKAGLD